MSSSNRNNQSGGSFGDDTGFMEDEETMGTSGTGRRGSGSTGGSSGSSGSM